MRATHACLLLFQLLALSDGQCACRTTTPPQNSTTMLPENTVVAVATTTMAAMAENATTTMGAVATTTSAPTGVAADEVAASSGPSSGPARVLTGMDADDRQLQEENASDVTTTTSQSMSQTETSSAEDCECPAPEVVSTFTSTLSLGSVDDLAALDFHAIKTALASDLRWGDSVVMVPVVKLGIQYTLDLDITEAQCKAAVAVAYSMSSDIDITEDDVECGDASAAPAPAPSPFLAPAPAPAPGPAPAPVARRLQTVKDVTISFTDTQAATAAATASQDTTHFTTALADAGVDAVVEVSEAVDVSVELLFTVTADAAIGEPTADSLESAVLATCAITVTAEISGFSSTNTRMPCSESEICSGEWQQVAGSEAIGCDGEVCTVEERDRCCSRMGTTGNAQGTCVLGSLFSLLLWHSF